MGQQQYGVARIDEGLRLDPCQFPQTIRFQSQGGFYKCVFQEHYLVLEGAPMSDQAIVRHLIYPSDILGISARAIEVDSCGKTVLLEIVLKNLDITIPLMVSRDLDQLLLDWRLWADGYNVPMKLREQDGHLRHVSERQPIFPIFNHRYSYGRNKIRLRSRKVNLGVSLKFSAVQWVTQSYKSANA